MWVSRDFHSQDLVPLTCGLSQQPLVSSESSLSGDMNLSVVSNCTPLLPGLLSFIAHLLSSGSPSEGSQLTEPGYCHPCICIVSFGEQGTPPPWLSLEQLSSHISTWASLAVLPPSHKVNHHFSSKSYRALSSGKNWSTHPISDMLLMSFLPETWVVPWEGHQIWTLFVTDQVVTGSQALPLHPCRQGVRAGRLQSAPGEL